MQKEIFFRKSGQISGSCKDYMEIIYKDKEEARSPTEDGIYISQCNDMIRIDGKGLSIGIDISKKDKKRFRLFFSTSQ